MAKKITLTGKQSKLYNQIRLEVKRANQRLVRLERAYGTNTWASKKLQSRLNTEIVNGWTESGRIKLNKSMSISQLKAVAKATKLFNNSKTSTVKGVKETIKNTKTGLRKILEDGIKIEDSEIETIYDLMSDDYLRELSEFIPPSDLAVILQESKEKYDSEENFIKRIENYIELGNDLDIKNKLSNIYTKYIV